MNPRFISVDTAALGDGDVLVFNAGSHVIVGRAGDGSENPDLSLKAPLDSPAFTGVPTAPTAGIGTDTDQLATMAALRQALDDLEGGAFSPDSIATLNGIAAGAIAPDDLFVVLDASSEEVKSLAASVLMTWIVSLLGNSATRNVGTTAGTVAAGDDPRFASGGGGTPTAISKAGGSVYVDDYGRPWMQSADGVIRIQTSPSGAQAQLRIGGIYLTAGPVGGEEFLIYQALAYMQFTTNGGVTYTMRNEGMGIGTGNPTAQLDLRNTVPTQPAAQVRAASGQSAFTLAAQSSEGTTRSGFNKTQDLETLDTRGQITVDRTTGQRVKIIVDNGKILLRSIDANNNETGTFQTFSSNGGYGQ